MTPILSLLSAIPSAFKLGLGAALVALIFFGGVYARGKWDAGTIADLQAKVTSSQLSVANLKDGLEASNKAVEAEKAASRARVKALQEAQAQAAERATHAQKSVQNILTAQPKPGQDLILSGLDLVMETQK